MIRQSLHRLTAAAVLTAGVAGAGLPSAAHGQGRPAFAGPPPVVPLPGPPAQPGALPLYPGGAPPLAGGMAVENWGTMEGYRVVRNVTVPTITPFLPAPGKATGAAVIVAPGGAFLMLSHDSEGTLVAQWLADRGIAAFLLKYRIEPTPADEAAATAKVMAKMEEAMRNDAIAAAPPSFAPAIDDGIAAVRVVRAGAARWGVDPDRVGMIGFSAGAMTALGVTLADKPDARPAFVGLIYGPMSPVTVPAAAPPLFAALAADDPLFGRTGFGLVDSWRKAGKSTELHLYHAGSHGFGMRPVGTSATMWPQEFHAWLASINMLKPAK
jgi:acetyl esterase/lipase